MSHEWKTALVEGPVTRAEKAETKLSLLRGQVRIIARGDMPSTGPECNSREDLENALMIWAQQALDEAA